ncbi:MAG: hypothetical protein U1C51_05150 [Candidatus Izemoplasmatales bacterium]|nr:hypothetical protein [bacterium]MDZ4196622.1 hypothetical protein [Candidatus Izemoplasmatales bacterium]
MKVDHTNEVEKRVEAIPVSILDGCSFYAQRDGSLLAVHLCVYCKFSEFVGNNKNGFCTYRLDNNRR